MFNNIGVLTKPRQILLSIDLRVYISVVFQFDKHAEC